MAKPNLNWTQFSRKWYRNFQTVFQNLNVQVLDFVLLQCEILNLGVWLFQGPNRTAVPTD